jgi:hypothetical protein
MIDPLLYWTDPLGRLWAWCWPQGRWIEVRQ